MSTSKEKIIESALELFHARGFQSTSVDDILKTTGVTKSNFYYHFRSKEELGLLVLDIRIREYENLFLKKILSEKETSPKMRLRHYYREQISYYRKLNYKKGCPFGNLALEMSDINENFRLKLSSFFNQWQKALEKCIKEGMKQKEFRDDISPKSISQLILSQIEGSILLMKTQGSVNPLSSTRRTIFNLLKPI